MTVTYTHEIVDTRTGKIVARGYGEYVMRNPEWMMEEFLNHDDVPLSERQFYIVREIEE